MPMISMPGKKISKPSSTLEVFVCPGKVAGHMRLHSDDTKKLVEWMIETGVMGGCFPNSKAGTQG